MKVSKYKSRAPEFLKDLQEQTYVKLKGTGMPSGQAEDIAASLAHHMCQHWGGQLLYFPKGESLFRSERDLRIYQEFNGHNHGELAQKFDTSVQWIYRIVETMRAEELQRRQPQLRLEGGG